MSIDVNNLTKSYGGTAVVKGIDLRIDPGEVVGFVGPNGAGKTSTIRMMVGLVRPDAGSVTIDGTPYAELERPLSEVGVVMGGATGHPRRRVGSHLGSLAKCAGVDRERVESLLGQVGMTGARQKRIGQLSLGMSQRVALAEALLGRPKYLLLDEPFTGLDLDGIRWLRSVIRQAAANGAGVLLSNHHMAEMELLADRLVVIGDGRILANSTLAELISNHGYSRLLISTEERDADLVTRLEASGFDALHTTHGVEVRVNDRRDLLVRVLDDLGVAPTDCVDVAPTIEDVFVDLTRPTAQYLTMEEHS